MLQVQHSQLAQDSIWLHIINKVMKSIYLLFFLHPSYNRKHINIYFPIESVKLNFSACGWCAQSRVKKIAQCKALALNREEHSKRCSSEKLQEATGSHLE